MIILTFGFFYTICRNVNCHSLSGGIFGIFTSSPLTQHFSICAPQENTEILIGRLVPLSLGGGHYLVTWFLISEMRRLCIVGGSQSHVQKFLLSLRYGDYPKLPDHSQQERDPWYDWDHPDLRLNWGEPVREPCPICPFFLFPMSSVDQMALFCPSGLSWWLSGEESACHCRRHGFDP